MPCLSAWEDLAITAPSALTSPAWIAAWAWLRLAANPCSTRNRSARVMKNASGDLANRGGILHPAKGVQRRGQDCIGIKARKLIHALRRVLIHEDVRQHHGANLKALVEQSFPSQELH